MDFQLLKSEVKELILQELKNNGVATEEQFQDRIHEITYTELDREIEYLSLKEIGEILMDFGLDKALYIAMSCGELSMSPPHWGENIYSPSILYQAVMENMSITWEDYQEYLEEGEEGDEGDEDDEEKKNCDDCNEPFKTVGSLTVRVLLGGEVLCRECCEKRV